MAVTKDLKRVTVQMPEELWKRLKRAEKLDDREFSAEVCSLLKSELDRRKIA